MISYNANGGMYPGLGIDGSFVWMLYPDTSVCVSDGSCFRMFLGGMSVMHFIGVGQEERKKEERKKKKKAENRRKMLPNESPYPL